MTYFLAQALINFCAGIMAAGLQRKIRKHAGIPNAAANTLTEERFIADVETVTGGTDKSSDAAA